MSAEAERHRIVMSLFRKLCDLDPVQQAVTLDEECGEDGALRDEVERLLGADSRQDQFDDDNVDQLVDDIGSAAHSVMRDELPARIGGYEVLEVIGSGGMGIVYLARQEDPSRTVALKVMRNSLSTPQLRKRFAAEAQALGKLQHPGIAHIIEASTTPHETEHRPFIAMEYIRGAPITGYARHEALDVGARVELLARVCDAVEHAHRQGIVHRDLKPLNILVTDEGQPKVLDFGLARAIDRGEQLTSFGSRAQIMGTLSYMSPEQAAGAAAIDQRCDVYSLGVVLFELLTDRFPIELGEVDLLEAIQIVQQRDPLSLGEVDGKLGGDLEVVVGKALRKEPALRYESAAAFAADLRRYLRTEPVVARPLTTFYRVRRFARRHWALVSAVAGIIVSLAIGLAFAMTSKWEADRQRDVAVQASTENAELADFLSTLLIDASPYHRGPGTLVIDVLNHAAESLPDRLHSYPVTAARLRHHMGKAYLQLDEFERSRDLLFEALRVHERELGPGDARTIEAAIAVAEFERQTDNLDAAIQRLRGVVDQVSVRDDLDRKIRIRAKRLLAEGYEAIGELEAGERLVLEVLDVEPGPDIDSELAFARVQRGRLLRLKSEYEQAGQWFTTLVANLRELPPTREHKIQLRHALLDYAGFLIDSDQSEAAVMPTREGVALSAELFGEDHSEFLVAASMQANVLYRAGRFEAALSAYQEVFDLRETIFGAEHRATSDARANVATALTALGRPFEAVPEFEAVLEEMRETGEADTPTYFRLATSLGRCYGLTGQREQAIELLRGAAARATEAIGAERHETLHAKITLGRTLVDATHYKEARALLEEVIEPSVELWEGEGLHVGALFQAYGIALAYLNESEGARKALERSLATMEATVGASHQYTVSSAVLLKQLAVRVGDKKEEARWQAWVEANTGGR